MNRSGFTLFELLVTLSIVVILLMIAIPSYQHLYAINKTSVVVNHVVDAIHSTRSSAMAENQIVAFCGSGDHQHCDGNWSKGQLIIEAQSQRILQNFLPANQHDKLLWKSSLGDNNSLKLAPNGFTDGQRGSFYYCPAEHPEKYGAKIVVSDSGRTRMEYNSEDLRSACN